MKPGMRGFCCDVKRIFAGYKLYIAIAGIAAAMFFSLESGGLEQSVVDTYFVAKLLSGYILSHSFAASVYGTVFCQELEHRYIYYELAREGLRPYAIKKVLMIYGSSVFAVVAGTMLFGFICRSFLPWSLEGTAAYEVLTEGVYGNLLVKGYSILFLFLNALHMGMLSGLLSLAAALFSLFITNRIMILSFPILIMEILFLVSKRISYPHIFDSTICLFDEYWMNIVLPVFISAAGILLFGILIYKVVQSRL